MSYMFWIRRLINVEISTQHKLIDRPNLLPIKISPALFYKNFHDFYRYSWDLV